jgi:hypothetical protein
MLHAILPFIELAAVSDAFNGQLTRTGSGGTPDIGNPSLSASTSASTFKVPLFICPDDDYRGMSPEGGIALNCYAGSAGPQVFGGGVNCPDAQQLSTTVQNFPPQTDPTTGKPYANGVSGLDRYMSDGQTKYRAPGPFMVHADSDNPAFSPVSLAQVHDGLSNTMMAGEIRPKCTSVSYLHGWASSTNGCGMITTVIPINYDSCDQTQNDPGNKQPGDCGYYANTSSSLGFKSAHPGGACFVMCDGAVVFWSEGIDYNTFQLLGAIDDGRAVTPP